MQTPIRFTGILPSEAAAALAEAIGETPVDAYLRAMLSADDIDQDDYYPQPLRDEISARVPAGETLDAVRPTYDQAGLLASTDKSFVWAWSAPAPGNGSARPVQGGRWDRDSAEPGLLKELPREIQWMLCRTYEVARDWDRVLEITSRVWFVGSTLFKANALKHKGLHDAALVAYDDAIREGEKLRIGLQLSARYHKAALLIELGDLPRARRELARLYADDPTYEDLLGLLGASQAPSQTTARESIPEHVRHAVWRRDEGRCVQCGSQQRLEFDHIIPVSRGGANTERNLQLLCEACNRSKGAAI